MTVFILYCILRLRNSAELNFVLVTPASVRDLSCLEESFANSAFNGISFLGVVATSLVNGIKVSGIGLDSSGSRLSVALRVPLLSMV